MHMKKRFYLTVWMACLSVTALFGVEPFEDWNSTPRWSYVSFSWRGNVYFTEGYHISGTLERKGKTYHALYFSRGYYMVNPDEPEGMGQPPVVKTQMGIRHENGRVLVDREQYQLLLSNSYWRYEGDGSAIPYPVTDSDELVLYDFTKQAGEVYCTLPSGDVVVSDVELLQTEDGASRRKLTLSNGLKLVEGIGCLNSRGHLLFYLNPADSPYGWGWLDAYSVNGQGVFSQSRKEIGDVILAYLDSLSADIHSSYKTARQTNASLFDLQGRRLTDQPRHGLYIRSGRKYVVR